MHEAPPQLQKPVIRAYYPTLTGTWLHERGMPPEPPAPGFSATSTGDSAYLNYGYTGTPPYWGTNGGYPGWFNINGSVQMGSRGQRGQRSVDSHNANFTILTWDAVVQGTLKSEEGGVGFCQPVGEEPEPGEPGEPAPPPSNYIELYDFTPGATQFEATIEIRETPWVFHDRGVATLALTYRIHTALFKLDHEVDDVWELRVGFLSSFGREFKTPFGEGATEDRGDAFLAYIGALRPPDRLPPLPPWPPAP